MNLDCILWYLLHTALLVSHSFHHLKVHFVSMEINSCSIRKICPYKASFHIPALPQLCFSFLSCHHHFFSHRHASPRDVYYLHGYSRVLVVLPYSLTLFPLPLLWLHMETPACTSCFVGHFWTVLGCRWELHPLQAERISQSETVTMILSDL